MSDVTVVALIPVAGRAGQDEHTAALVAAAVRQLTSAVPHVTVLGTSDMALGCIALGDIDAPATAASLADHAVAVANQPGVRVILVHDPLRARTPADVVTRVVDEVLRTGQPVVPVLPCSDTVKRLDDAGVVIDTPDRAELRVLQSPVGYPAELIASGAIVAGTVPAGTRTVAGDPRARRLATAVDIAMIDGGHE